MGSSQISAYSNIIPASLKYYAFLDTGRSVGWARWGRYVARKIFFKFFLFFASRRFPHVSHTGIKFGVQIWRTESRRRRRKHRHSWLESWCVHGVRIFFSQHTTIDARFSTRPPKTSISLVVACPLITTASLLSESCSRIRPRRIFVTRLSWSFVIIVCQSSSCVRSHLSGSTRQI